jgi:hypothetical protein
MQVTISARAIAVTNIHSITSENNTPGVIHCRGYG